MVVIRFGRGTLLDLVGIMKSMYDIGQVPVKIAFKDPKAIGDIPFPRFLDMMIEAGLPAGTVGVEPHANLQRAKPFSVYLVYRPGIHIY